jgi:hypothetical protein
MEVEETDDSQKIEWLQVLRQKRLFIQTAKAQLRSPGKPRLLAQQLIAGWSATPQPPAKLILFEQKARPS